MGRFPWKVAPLLAEAKKMFCKTTGDARSGEQCKKTVTEETGTAQEEQKEEQEEQDT